MKLCKLGKASIIASLCFFGFLLSCIGASTARKAHEALLEKLFSSALAEGLPRAPGRHGSMAIDRSLAAPQLLRKNAPKLFDGMANANAKASILHLAASRCCGIEPLALLVCRPRAFGKGGIASPIAFNLTDPQRKDEADGFIAGSAGAEEAFLTECNAWLY